MRRFTHAFTLIEIMVVCAIVFIVAALVVPAVLHKGVRLAVSPSDSIRAEGAFNSGSARVGFVELTRPRGSYNLGDVLRFKDKATGDEYVGIIGAGIIRLSPAKAESDR